MKNHNSGLIIIDKVPTLVSCLERSHSQGCPYSGIPLHHICLFHDCLSPTPTHTHTHTVLYCHALCISYSTEVKLYTIQWHTADFRARERVETICKSVLWLSWLPHALVSSPNLGKAKVRPAARLSYSTVPSKTVLYDEYSTGGALDATYNKWYYIRTFSCRLFGPTSCFST